MELGRVSFTLQAVVLKEKGNEALRSNKMEEAYAFYTEAILLDPSRKEFFSNRCAALLALERHEEALADAQVLAPTSCPAGAELSVADSEGNGQQLGKGLLPRGTGAALELIPSRSAENGGRRIWGSKTPRKQPHLSGRLSGWTPPTGLRRASSMRL